MLLLFPSGKKLLIGLISPLRTFSSVQSLSRVRLFATPWIAARQASGSITNSRSSSRLMPIESVMPSSHLILCCPLLLLPTIPPSIRVSSNESTLRMRWSQGWSPSEWTSWISLQSKGLSRVFSNTTDQKHQFFGAQPSSQSNSHIHTLDKNIPCVYSGLEASPHYNNLLQACCNIYRSYFHPPELTKMI